MLISIINLCIYILYICIHIHIYIIYTNIHTIQYLDIKPENILFESSDETARLKITDFGLSRMLTLEEEILINKVMMIDEMNKQK